MPKPHALPEKQEGSFHAALEPESMRAYLLEHPISNGGRLWCDRILAGVDRGERTALRLFSEAMKWTGGQVNIGTLLVQLGARDEREARTLINEGRKFEALRRDATASLADLEHDAVEVLRMILSKHPDRRSAIMSRLESMAMEISENGDHGDGS